MEIFHEFFSRVQKKKHFSPLPREKKNGLGKRLRTGYVPVAVWKRACPLPEMRQEFLRSLGIANEIIIHKVNGVAPAIRQLIQFVDDLLRCFQARVSPIKPGNIAELAGERATAGKLNRTEQIFSQVNALIGRRGKFRHGQSFHRMKGHLFRRPFNGFIQPLKQSQGTVAYFSTMDQVNLGIIFRGG